MSFPPRPKRAVPEPPEPHFSGARTPSAQSRFAAEDAAEGAAPLRFPGGERGRERQLHAMPVLSAGERLVVSSAITGGGAPRRRLLRSVLLAALCLLAAVGAVTIYHSLAGAFPH